MIVDKATARKDYPNFDILKGDIHYKWKSGGIVYRSRELPIGAKLRQFNPEQLLPTLDTRKELIESGFALWEACWIYKLVPDERTRFIKALESLIGP